MTGILRTAIYGGLFYAWGISIQWRIVHRRIAHMLEGIVTLMLFWLCMRTLKYFVFFDYTGLRMTWYAYYVAILFIPALSLLVSLRMGKPESFRQPKMTAFVLGISTLLVLLVMTNDFHQLVFTFPEGKPFSDLDYDYHPVFWIVTAWEAVTSIGTLLVILKKCRNPYAKQIQWRPFLPFAVLCLYVVFYVSGAPVLREWFGDSTVFECCLVIAIWESCLQCGLIQCNTGYDRLFRASTMMAQITDPNLNVRYRSDHVIPVDRSILKTALENPVLLNDNVRLSSASIEGGYVFWQEDIASLIETQKKLNGVKEELKSYGNFIQEENRKKARQKQLKAKKKLYDEVTMKTARSAELLSKKALQLRETTEDLLHDGY